MTPASVADITALKSMDLDLPDGATLFGDRAYNHYFFEEELLGDAKIRLIKLREDSHDQLALVWHKILPYVCNCSSCLFRLAQKGR